MSRPRTRYYVFSRAAGLALAAAILVAGCSTRVRDIQRDPPQYIGQEVTVTGIVGDSVSVMGYGAFKLVDGTGSIWVVTPNVPADGTSTKVSGVVASGVSIPGVGDVGVVIKAR